MSENTSDTERPEDRLSVLGAYVQAPAQAVRIPRRGA